MPLPILIPLTQCVLLHPRTCQDVNSYRLLAICTAHQLWFEFYFHVSLLFHPYHTQSQALICLPEIQINLLLRHREVLATAVEDLKFVPFLPVFGSIHLLLLDLIELQ